jgi:hypothetical protein
MVEYCQKLRSLQWMSIVGAECYEVQQQEVQQQNGRSVLRDALGQNAKWQVVAEGVYPTATPSTDTNGEKEKVSVILDLLDNRTYNVRVRAVMEPDQNDDGLLLGSGTVSKWGAVAEISTHPRLARLSSSGSVRFTTTRRQASLLKDILLGKKLRKAVTIGLVDVNAIEGTGLIIADLHSSDPFLQYDITRYDEYGERVSPFLEQHSRTKHCNCTTSTPPPPPSSSAFILFFSLSLFPSPPLPTPP